MEHLASHTQITGLPSSGNDLHHYLLLDGVKMEPVLKWVYQFINNPEWYPLYKNTRYHDVIDISPCLVKIPADSGMANQFENELGPQGQAILLGSSLDIDALGVSLSQLLWITTDKGQYLHFRFYDPITLSRLIPSLQTEECAKLYNGIGNIVWFDVKQDTWQMLTIPHSSKGTERLGGMKFKSEWIDAIVSTD